MTEAIIRQYREDDIPALIEFWLENFDDTREFVLAFYEALPKLGGAVVAELEGKIVGASHVLSCQELSDLEGKSVALGLVYGVSVSKSSRRGGLGEKLVKASQDLSERLGAEIFCCEPASVGLVGWYEKISGLRSALRREKHIIKAAEYGSLTKLSAEEYSAQREEMLKGKNHVKLSPAAMDFEAHMLGCYGGSFIGNELGIAAAYMYEKRAMIRELICTPGNENRFAAEIAAAMSAEDAEYCLSSSDGGDYILADKAIAKTCIWNLSFS